jgi:hypothetical protein
LPDLNKAKDLTARQMARQARTGDILLTRSSEPASGFKLFTTALTGSPVYHGEYVVKRPGRGVQTALAGAKGLFSLPETLSRENEMAVLVRPKILGQAGRHVKNQLVQEAIKGVKNPYSDLKVGLAGLYQALVPQSKLLGKLPHVCKGDVCTTLPATAMRNIGVDPQMRVLPGMELAGDYLRNPNYKVVGRWGKHKFSSPGKYLLTSALPARLALGAGLGLGAYHTTKDVREGRPWAPVAALGGALGGGVAGLAFENMAVDAYADPAKMKAALVKKLGKVIAAHRAKRIASSLTRVMKNTHSKYSLLPAALLMALGGGGAYMAARKAYGD